MDMAYTPAQIQALYFGYLIGANLMRWCPWQILSKQNEVDSTCLQDGCNTAYDEIISACINRYDIATEMAKNFPQQGMAKAEIAGGAVTALDIITPGTKYLTPPTVAFAGPGTDAAATATIDQNGILTGFVITNGGSGYTSSPVVSLSGGLAPDSRAGLCVKVVSILAVRNALGNAQNISEKMAMDFAWAEKFTLALRNGQANLPLNPVPKPVPPVDPVTGCRNPYPASNNILVESSFKTIG